MRKFIIAAFLCALLVPFAGCSKNVDYTKYISERRINLYLYSDDETDLKIYCSRREQPYSADGYCGETCDVVEIFVSFVRNPAEVTLTLEEYTGEMSYQSVENRYFLSFSASAYTCDDLTLTLTCDGKQREITALGSLSAGVLSCEQALQCVLDYDRAYFDGLTRNGVFDGEIFVRLLYDDGCYYYVGVCDKTKKINAYLLDGERGKIIATKQIQG